MKTCFYYRKNTFTHGPFRHRFWKEINIFFNWQKVHGNRATSHILRLCFKIVTDCNISNVICSFISNQMTFTMSSGKMLGLSLPSGKSYHFLYCVSFVLSGLPLKTQCGMFQHSGSRFLFPAPSHCCTLFHPLSFSGMHTPKTHTKSLTRMIQI